mmetsp:Transcript_8482/g.20435  ORF Transcript_8482/g.20435 Transcript_8482/m.20435 type:complete len:290 (+) Transcript_8482:157-1026(+)
MISSGNIDLDVLDGDDDNFSDVEISLREDSDAEGAGCSGGDDRSPTRGLEGDVSRSPANGTLRNYGDRDQSCSRQGSGHATSPKSQSGCGGNNKINSAHHSSTTSKPPSSGDIFPFQDGTSVVVVRCAICGSPRSSRVVLESLHQSEDEVAKRARNRTSSSSSRAPAACSSAADGRNKKVLVVVDPPVRENYKVNDRDYPEQKTNDDDVPQAVARCVFCEKPICAECVHSFNCNSPLDCCFPARRWKTNVYCGFCYVAERERRIRRHIQGQMRQSRPSTLSTRNGASAL